MAVGTSCPVGQVGLTPGSATSCLRVAPWERRHLACRGPEARNRAGETPALPGKGAGETAALPGGSMELGQLRPLEGGSC